MLNTKTMLRLTFSQHENVFTHCQNLCCNVETTIIMWCLNAENDRSKIYYNIKIICKLENILLASQALICCPNIHTVAVHMLKWQLTELLFIPNMNKIHLTSFKVSEDVRN